MELISMLKINLLAITLTSLLSACASNGPSPTQEAQFTNTKRLAQYNPKLLERFLSPLVMVFVKLADI
jgi:hypothetical protein